MTSILQGVSPGEACGLPNGGHGGLAPARGHCPCGVRPPFSFWSCPKRECAAPGGREKIALTRSGTFVPPRCTGGRCISASADFTWPSGTLGLSAIPVTAVPWQMVPTSLGWSSHRLPTLFAAAGRSAQDPVQRADEGISPYREAEGFRACVVHAATIARVARSEAERVERGAGQMRSCNPVDLRTRAAGINCQVRTAPRRARRQVLANPQAPSHTDPRTARRATAPERD